jgi:hypothetical protein
MANLVFRTFLFFSSYLPLVPVFCLLYWDAQPRRSVILLVAGLVVLALVSVYLKLVVPKINTVPVRVREVQARDIDTMSYIAAYILPFLTFTLDSWKQILAIVFTFAIFGFLYVNSSMISINPTLNLLFRYHLYDIVVEGKEDEHFFLLSHRKRLPGSTLMEVVDLGVGILVETGKE